MRAVGLTLALAFATLARAQGRPGRITPRELDAQLGIVEHDVGGASDRLKLVETELIDRADPTPKELAKQRFHQGEVAYLLGDWSQASVLFYDLVSDPRFQGTPQYADALYYLGDALAQQGDDQSARAYLKTLLAIDSPHFEEALARYLEVMGRLGQTEGIEPLLERARARNGRLPSELAYLYAKWLFQRTDLATAERLDRTQAAFLAIAQAPRDRYAPEARYFLGVIATARGDLPTALTWFQRAAKSDPAGPRTQQVIEEADLALGRVLFEQGHYSEAIDRYQEVKEGSKAFPDALYETAWARVKLGDFHGAKDALEILLLVAPDSRLAPDANLLHAHLLLKLGEYQDARDTYSSVIDQYAPVRDELDALLHADRDPVAYFDRLLARNGRHLQVAQLLPKVALKWGSTAKDIGRATQMIDDLQRGEQARAESEAIAHKLIEAIDTRGMKLFPALQQGFARAEAVESALAQSEQALVRIEEHLVRDALTPEEAARLTALRAEVTRQQARFEKLPKSEKELEARRARRQAKLDVVDHRAFELGYDVQGMHATVTAIRKWVADTEETRSEPPGMEKAFLSQVDAVQAELVREETELAGLRGRIGEARGETALASGTEDSIRHAYEQAVAAQDAQVASVEGRLSGEAAAVALHAHELKARIGEVRRRSEAAKLVLQEKVKAAGEAVKKQVAGEQRLLAGYQDEANGLSGATRLAVGRIAFGSFKKVRQQFYDLVLKADVGLVDVAFTRKQDETKQIQALSAKEDDALQALDHAFAAVRERSP